MTSSATENAHPTPVQVLRTLLMDPYVAWRQPPRARGACHDCGHPEAYTAGQKSLCSVCWTLTTRLPILNSVKDYGVCITSAPVKMSLSVYMTPDHITILVGQVVHDDWVDLPLFLRDRGGLAPCVTLQQVPRCSGRTTQPIDVLMEAAQRQDPVWWAGFLTANDQHTIARALPQQRFAQRALEVSFPFIRDRPLLMRPGHEDLLRALAQRLPEGSTLSDQQKSVFQKTLSQTYRACQLARSLLVARSQALRAQTPLKDHKEFVRVFTEFRQCVEGLPIPQDLTDLDFYEQFLALKG